ncbi:MAG: putative sporulation protein YtxC [Clostridia bacterium]|nr:putative sporulation protein YtxC [Clostridia bacterium]
MSKEEFAREISAVIMEEYEPKLIEKCVYDSYGFLDREETDRIMEIAREMEREGGAEPCPSFAERESMVREAAEEYLKEEKAIVPRGLVDFRIKELSMFAEFIAGSAADAYFAEQEYEEFTSMLAMFMEVRPKLERALHIVWNEGEIKLFNRVGRDVTEKYTAEFIKYAEERGAGAEDLAISAVIAAAPEKIVLHCPPEASPLAGALEHIFGEKCEICHGCNFCER